MKGLSLFSGIGGIDLACEWAGIETVAFCEQEPFCQKVLHKHWPNVPIYDDIRNLSKARLEADGIDSGAIRIIHGGYPCQPFSIAGNRQGENDDRHLWPEIRRLLQEIKPKWFVGENVANHITLGLDQTLSDLEDIGYTWETFVIPAVAINAPHRRDRVFIVGFISDSSGVRHEGDERLQKNIRKIKQWRTGTFRPTAKLFDDIDWKKRARESGFLRGNDGIPYRMDRIKALGNAVVPQQIYPILAAIKKIDDLMTVA